MGSYHPRRPSKRDLPDKNLFTIHEINDENTISRDWNSANYITIISVDPGITNFGLRIERRPFGPDVWKVEVLHYANTCFKQCKTNTETNSSSLYRSITEYLKSLNSNVMDAHLILIERQLPVNHNMVRVSQHIITYFMTVLSDSTINPLIVEIDSSGKTKILGAPKGLSSSQVKDWSIEKSLQLSYIRKDWTSFMSILEATKNKSDDLADTMVQIEAICRHLKWGTTPIPPKWEEIPIMSGWQTGQIFFRHLLKLTGLPKIHLETTRSLKGWLSLFRKHKPEIIGSRNKLVSIKRKPVSLSLNVEPNLVQPTRYLDIPSTVNSNNQVRLIIDG
uniref:Holliday junction resolvase n=1 Tax=Pithovirus LCPAC201 TaxID=2506591 RepID=A0A481Z5F1_9VIRU|nr:MAG: holliday junction resolvase [Pithovirus LCPAC201]